jgi:flavin reductase (DIM6/NTAB) family NADH-FMN oxidoreductase RutF
MADTFQHFDFSALSKGDIYKLLASTVLPRPIAWITSRDAEGTLNAAPFSFFNVLSSDPPILAFSFAGTSDRDKKDTLHNILAHHQFVVNMVPEELAEAMNITATNAPRGVDEVALAGLETAPSSLVDVPRLAGSPVAFECELLQTLNFGGASTIGLGRVLAVSIRTDAFENLERLHIDPSKMRLVGRMHGAGGYTTTRDVFHIERKNWPLGESS